MLISPDYALVHGRLLKSIENGIADKIPAQPTVFQCKSSDVSYPDDLEITALNYDPELYDEERARFMVTIARIRCIGLHAFMAMERAIRSEDSTTHPLEYTYDKAAGIFLDNKTIELTKTTVKSGDEEATSHQITDTANGEMHRLQIVSINGDYIHLKDSVTFENDPELERVFSFLLPKIDTVSHEILINLLTGRLENIERSAAKILVPFIGSSLEEEATRVLDIVVDRATAALSTKGLGPISLGLPSESRLLEWIDKISQI